MEKDRTDYFKKRRQMYKSLNTKILVRLLTALDEKLFLDCRIRKERVMVKIMEELERNVKK